FQNIRESRPIVARAQRGYSSNLGSRDSPWNEPEQTCGADRKTHRAPSQSIEDQAARDHSAGGTKLASDIDQSIRQSALPLGETRRDDLRVRRICNRLADPQEQAQGEQHYKSGGETGQRRG